MIRVGMNAEASYDHCGMLHFSFVLVVLTIICSAYI